MKWYEVPLPPKFSLCYFYKWCLCFLNWFLYFRKWCPNFENGASIFVYGALILKMVPLFSRDANLWRSKIWTFFFYNTPVSNYFLYHYQRMRQRLLRVLSLVSTNPFQTMHPTFLGGNSTVESKFFSLFVGVLPRFPAIFEVN